MRLQCRLRELRGDRSIRDLEQASGVARGMLSLIERGRMLPTDDEIAALELAYGRPWHHWYPRPIVAVIEYPERPE